MFSDQEGSGLGKWGGPPQGTFYSQEKVPRDLSLKISVRSCVFLKRKHPKKAYFDVFFRFSSYRHMVIPSYGISAFLEFLGCLYFRSWYYFVCICCSTRHQRRILVIQVFQPVDNVNFFNFDDFLTNDEMIG